MNETQTNKKVSEKEDLKPTQKDIIDANNRVSLENLESFRQAMREYLAFGGKLTFPEVKENE